MYNSFKAYKGTELLIIYVNESKPMLLINIGILFE